VAMLDFAASFKRIDLLHGADFLASFNFLRSARRGFRDSD